MKLFRKVASVLLAATLVLAMGMTTMAADITIDNDETGHSYMAYQIFKGVLDTTDAEGKTLNNIDWGDGLTDAGKEFLLNKVPLGDGQDVNNLEAADYAETLQGQGAEKANELATILVDNNYLQKSKGLSYTGSAYTIDNLENGYYLITDTSSTGAVSAYMVAVAGEDVEITPKTGVPTLEKKVKDANDSEGTITEWQDSADYDIGDVIPFQLTATLPASAYGHFETYYLAFEDNMCDGLVLDKTSIKVYHVAADGTETLVNSSNYALSYSKVDEDDFKVAITDLKKAVPNAASGDKIVVRYSATLTGDAVVVGSEGNPNTAYITYQNDPNYTGNVIPGEYGENDKLDSDKDGQPDPEDSDGKDTDGDGIPDVEDGDDDNDGLTDGNDPDDDNDGIPDTEEDTDGDGIPDDEERDTDNDGKPDDSDTNDDNDGELDVDDDDDDGDGIPDDKEDENDNGTPDVNDGDTDGDGTPDVWEEGSSADEVLDDTPKDTVIVFTYELVVDKVDEEGNALSGAEFTLYKYNENGLGEVPVGYPDYHIVKKLTPNEADDEHDIEAGVTFTLTGLDDGKYLLVETKTPTGYNTIKPVEFTVTALHDENTETAKKPVAELTSLKVTPEDSFTATTSTGLITTEIENQAGTRLPETGGVGTTIFYIVGGILVVGAAILLITKKRMENK